MPSPNVVVKLPNGKQNDIYAEVEDACALTNFFATIAKRVGPYLNDTNWVNTVDNFGPIDDTSTIYASIHKGKYDADDTYGLVAYDPTVGAAGDWTHVTPVRERLRRLSAPLGSASAVPAVGVRPLDRAVVGAEVRRDDERIVADRLGFAVRDHRTGFHAVDAVADRHDERQVVLDDDERGVELALDPLDQRAERLGLALGDTRGRFVEADDARRDREHRRELDDAAGTGRELDDEAVGVAAEAEEVDELGRLGPLRALLGDRRRIEEQRSPERRRAARLERELHGLAHGELGEQPSRLGRCGRARRAPGGAAASRETSVAEQLDLAPARHVAADRVQQRRLARAVRADEADDLARLRVEVDPVDRDQAAEVDAERRGRDDAAVGVRDDRRARRAGERDRRRGDASSPAAPAGVARASAGSCRAARTRAA